MLKISLGVKKRKENKFQPPAPVVVIDADVDSDEERERDEMERAAKRRKMTHFEDGDIQGDVDRAKESAVIPMVVERDWRTHKLLEKEKVGTLTEEERAKLTLVVPNGLNAENSTEAAGEKIVVDEGQEANEDADYSAISIESFGLAILRGCNWKDGDGIGKNPQKVALKLPNRRPPGLGLGATPRHPDGNKRKGQIAIPRKRRLKKIVAVAVGAKEYERDSKCLNKNEYDKEKERIEKEREKYEEPSTASSSKKSKYDEEDSRRDEKLWARTDLLVRFIDENFKQGTLFKQKVRIVDVAGKEDITIEDDRGRTHYNVRQSYLELENYKRKNRMNDWQLYTGNIILFGVLVLITLYAVLMCYGFFATKRGESLTDSATSSTDFGKEFSKQMAEIIFILETSSKKINLLVEKIEKNEKRRRYGPAEDEDTHNGEAKEELDYFMELEASCLGAISDLTHSLMKEFKGDIFESMLNVFDCAIQLTEGSNRLQRQWGMRLLNDAIEFGVGHLPTRFPKLIPVMHKLLDDNYPEVRQAASYGFGAMAIRYHQVPDYKNEIMNCLDPLAEMIQHDDARATKENNVATENAISAYAKIIANVPMPPEKFAEVVEMFLSWLPTYSAKEESPCIYTALADLFDKQDPALFGQDNQNMPRIFLVCLLSIADEAFNDDDHGNETKKRIETILKTMQGSFPHIARQEGVDVRLQGVLQRVLNGQ